MIQNHEPFAAVWLDSRHADDYQTLDKRKAQLSSIINFNVKFSNSDECLDYIKNIQHENIFFIVSGSLGQNIIPIIFHLPQILYIYIYCSDKIKHEQWASDKIYSTKMHGIFDDIDLLLAKINEDVKCALKNIFPINIFNKYDNFKSKELTMKDLNKQSAQFMWFQLLIDTIFRGSYSQDAKDNMFDECVNQYDGNDIELKRIVDFHHNYTPQQAISWYTRDCFVYRLINKAFRIQNINFIYQFRFFIKDLYNQLKELWLSQNKNSSSITAYRGQLMNCDEFQTIKQNIGQLISVNTFFSTTLSSQVAIDFTGNGFGRPDYESVFFEINIDSCSSVSKPFANIKGLSFIKDEDEILFCVGTIFRIISVDEYEWASHVILESTNDEIIELKDLIEYISINSLEKTSTPLALANLLEEMGEYEKAEHFFQLLLAESPPPLQQWLYGPVENTIGLLDYQKGNYREAMKRYEKGLSMQSQQQIIELSSDDQETYQNFLSATYNNIGMIYTENAEYDKALNLFNKAISHISNDHIGIACIMCNIGILYSGISEYQLALEYCEKALKIRSDKLPKYHPQIAVTYGNIGAIHHDMGNYDLALQFYKNAEEIYRAALPVDHPSQAKIQVNIGMIYLDKSDFQSAIELTSKALSIFTTYENHPVRAIMYNNLGLAYSNCGDYTLSLENFEKALQIRLVSLPENHLDIAASYNNIACVYVGSETNYELALENYEKHLKCSSNIIHQKSIQLLH